MLFDGFLLFHQIFSPQLLTKSRNIWLSKDQIENGETRHSRFGESHPATYERNASHRKTAATGKVFFLQRGNNACSRQSDRPRLQSSQSQRKVADGYYGIRAFRREGIYMIALTACRLPGRLVPLRMPIWSIQCWIRQLPCCRRTRNRLFIPTVAVITAGRDGSGGCRLQGSDVPCQRKDVLRTTLPARAFSDI